MGECLGVGDARADVTADLTCRREECAVVAFRPQQHYVQLGQEQEDQCHHGAESHTHAQRDCL